MADDLSLLFRLRAENSQAKAAIADTRQAVSALRSSFGTDLKQMQGVARSALSEIGDNVNAFVGQRIPLIGGAFLRVTSNLKGLNDELRRGGPQTAALSQQIDSIAKSSGKSTTEVARFLTTFTRLEGQAARNDAAFKFFGGSTDLIGNKTAKFLPQLEAAGSELAQVSTAATATGSAMAGMAGPIGIAIAAIAAEIVVVVTLTKEIYALAKASADYQGKLFDLSQQTGVTVETLSALDIAIRKVGGSTEGAAQPLTIFQTKLEEAQDSSSTAGKAFRLLGVDALDTETALRQTLTALAAMPEGFEQTTRARELFGRGGRFFLALLKETGGDIDEVTRRFKGLGGVTTEQAALADEFNDKLIDLEVQLRGIGTQAIPIVLEALKDLSKTIEENRDLFRVLQGIVQAVAITIFGPLRAALLTIKVGFEAAKPVILLIAEAFRKIKEAIEFISGHPVKLPGFDGASTTTPPTPPSARPDPTRKDINDQIEARQKLLGVLSIAYAQQQRQAEASIALAQREFEAGKRTRQQLLEATIEGTGKQIKAATDELEFKRSIKLREAALAKDDVEKQRALFNDLIEIDKQIADKRAEQTRKEADERAKFRLDEQKAELAHYQARTDITIKEAEQRIAAIEDLLRREKVDRETALAEIEKIENAAIAARGQLLKFELGIAGVGPDRQIVLDKIKAIETDRTALERLQSERRKQLTREEFEEKRQILISNLDALLQIEQIRGNARIATIQAQAALRIKTEEQAAKEILAIRLRLLDSEIEAVQAKQKAAGGIADPKQRRQEQAQLANDLKILNAQREAIQAEGNREIEEKRQQDLRNEREYWEDLKDIKQRTREIELDTAQEVIRLMVQNFARRKDIIRAQRDLDLQEEGDRHRRVTESIQQQESEVDEQIRILESHLKSLKIGTDEEIAQYERLIEQLEKLRLKRAELEEQQKREDERNKTRKRRVKDDSKRDEDEADPIGRFDIDIKRIARELEDTVVPLGELLKNTFTQVADAIGSVIENWVLLGETGPAVMRKILAVALASLAKEAAVNAIKELALGFATLFFNPGESAAHFTAAALWGSIAGGAAIAGRSVAGDLFKSKSPASEGASAGSPQPLNTIAGRNQPQNQTITVVVKQDIKTDGGQIVKTWVDDYNNGGVTREVVANDGR